MEFGVFLSILIFMLQKENASLEPTKSSAPGESTGSAFLGFVILAGPGYGGYRVGKVVVRKMSKKNSLRQHYCFDLQGYVLLSLRSVAINSASAH